MSEMPRVLVELANYRHLFIDEDDAAAYEKVFALIKQLQTPPSDQPTPLELGSPRSVGFFKDDTAAATFLEILTSTIDANGDFPTPIMANGKLLGLVIPKSNQTPKRSLQLSEWKVFFRSSGSYSDYIAQLTALVNDADGSPIALMNGDQVLCHITPVNHKG